MNIFLDDCRQEPVNFVRTFTVQETIQLIEKNHVEILSLDNDLGENLQEGYKVLDWLEEQVLGNNRFELIPDEIKIHSANSSARERMKIVIERIYNAAKK